MGYRIRETGGLRDLTSAEQKIVQNTRNRIKCLNYIPNKLEAYEARATQLKKLKETHPAYQNYVMYHVAVGSGDVDESGESRGDFTAFDFEGEQSLAGFIAREFSEQLRAGRK